MQKQIRRLESICNTSLHSDYCTCMYENALFYSNEKNKQYAVTLTWNEEIMARKMWDYALSF